jgi:hypothetical protein
MLQVVLDIADRLPLIRIGYGETTLASLGVSQDLRAQIQSHGLGGIQQKHHNRHDYSDEKREALLRWAHWLQAGPSRRGKVIAGRFRQSKGGT